MATKTYCDGCDKELQAGFVYKTTVSVQITGEVKQAGGDYDLCKSCMDYLCRDSNPRNWTRCSPMIKSA